MQSGGQNALDSSGSREAALLRCTSKDGQAVFLYSCSRPRPDS
jgi:hypothetical protein